MGRLADVLAAIAAGECPITRDTIAEEPDGPRRELLSGLLALHLELELRRQRQGEAEEALRRANTDLEALITARTAALKKTQEQLAQAQRMEAVGRLAGGIAHDFNNLLSVVLSYTSILLEDLNPKDPLREDVEEIAAAGKRASELTRGLLAFSRRQVLEPATVDLNDVVEEMDRMIRRIIGADVSLSVLPSKEPGYLRADPGQLEQVIMNLVVNARDAMPKGGRLTIETLREVVDEGYPAQHVDLVPGPYVMLAITDSGTGMTRETQARIFEPFFTTKAVGEGTGLGLSTVFGIVRQSGGDVWVYSEVGRGTVFKLYFPLVEAPNARPTLPPSSVPQSRCGTETILVVEDQDQVRGVVRDILRRYGYRVLEAPNGGEALLICEQYGAQIHLLLADVILPHMSGRQLVDRVATLRPEMRALFMSGYAGDIMLNHGVAEAGVSFLQKPITPGALTRKIREVLDADS